MNSKKTIKLLFTSALLLGFLFVNAQNWANLNRYREENSSIKSSDANETMVTTSKWDEAIRCIGVWKDGHAVTLLNQPDPNDGCWGWGTDTQASAM